VPKGVSDTLVKAANYRRLGREQADLMTMKSSRHYSSLLKTPQLHIGWGVLGAHLWAKSGADPSVFFSHLQPLVAQHGYWVVFLIVMLESAGIPLPGETALVLASIYAGATDQLNIAFVIASAAAGAILGDNIGFWVGRTWGLTFLLRYGKLIHLPEKRLRLGQYLFATHGAKIVFFGRFVAFLRVFAALLAGVNQYKWPPFLFFNAAGGIVWAIVFGAGAYLFGESIHLVSGPLGVAALGGVVIGVIVFTRAVRRQEKKMEEQITAADIDLRLPQ
jgi:membrane protein DedA with SNARE-associated domain